MEPTETPPKETEKPASGGEPSEDVVTLRERLSAMEATMKEREESYRRDMEEIKRKHEAPPPSPDAREKELKAWEERFERDGFVPTMIEYEQRYLMPNLQRVTQAAEGRIQHVLDKVARREREEIKQDRRCTSDVLAKVDQIAGQLDPDKRSEPGAYREILNQVLGHETWAESQMRGGDMNATRTRRGPDIDVEQEREEPELSRDEIKWAKRWGMSPKEFKKLQAEKEVEV